MTVYITQLPVVKDRWTGDMVPKFPALEEGGRLREELTRRYGRVEVMLQRGAQPNEESSATIKKKLSSFTESDHLLLLGSPVLMSVAAVYAADRTDTLRLLQWEARAKQKTNFRAGTYAEIVVPIP